MPVRSLAIAILLACVTTIGAASAWAQISEPPKIDAPPPTSGPKPEGLAQSPSETAPVTPHVEERTGSGGIPDESAPVRPEGPEPLPERPSEPRGAPKEIR